MVRSSYVIVVFLTAATVFGQVDDRNLPTGRAITPAGDIISFPGRPVDLETTPDQSLLLIKDRKNLRIVDTESFELLESHELTGGASLYGLVTTNEFAFCTNAKNQIQVFKISGKNPNGETIDVKRVEHSHQILLPDDSFPCGLTLLDNQKQLAVCLSKRNSVAIVDIAKRKMTAEISVGVAPFDVIQIENQLVVTNIGGRRATDDDTTAPSAETETVVDKRGIASTGTISVVSLAELKVENEIAVGLHPSVIGELSGRAIVCNTNQDSIAVVNPGGNESTFFETKPDTQMSFGSMPSCLRLLPDGKHLLVSLAGNNAMAVLKSEGDKFETKGYVPTAWYPASIACTKRHVFVGNIKGFGARARARDAEKGRNSHDHLGVVQRIPDRRYH